MTDVTDVVRATRLVARSTRIDAPADLLDHLAPGGFAFLEGDAGFVAAGVAATVAPEHASTLLASIEHHADPDAPAPAGPRAVGALPFAGRGRLVIPARIVARAADGTAWCTHIDNADVPKPLSSAAPSPAQFSVGAAVDRVAWQAMVEDALARIERGELAKVVLARTATVTADRPWDTRCVLGALRVAQPGCVVYGDGGFVGASPELLVRKHGASVYARPLAGTGTDPQALLASAKDEREHAFVVDAVVAALQSRCGPVQVDGPSARVFANVSHLATTVTARAAAGVDVIDLVHALHPTPAVAGTPTAAALDAINAIEPVARGRYAGPCGWVDARGDGAFVVALRGGEIDGSHATLYAGAGIVAGSQPDAEWAETQQKLTPMLQALVRP
jgi:menaquinone-specific isochorismate synthase